MPVSKRRIRPIYLLAVMMGLAVLLLWLRHLNNRLYNATDVLENRLTNDDTYLLITGVHLRRFDQNGYLTMIVVADEAYQAAQDQPLELRSVTVTSHGVENGASVELARIISRFAIYNPLLATLATCQQYQDCYATAIPGTSSDSPTGATTSRWQVDQSTATSTWVQLLDYTTTPMTLVKSSRLLYDTQTRKVTNDEPTSILRGDSLLTGIGLMADLSTHHYRIRQDVKTTFIESPPTTSQAE